jgi:hypothetical protein
LIRWGPYFDNARRDLTFAVTSPAPSPISLSFAGIASFDGTDQPVVGDALILQAVRLSSLTLLPQGGFGLKIGPADGIVYRIESSIDLRAWRSLSVATNLNGMLRFSDPDSKTAPQKFYRAVSQP